MYAVSWSISGRDKYKDRKILQAEGAPASIPPLNRLNPRALFYAPRVVCEMRARPVSAHKHFRCGCRAARRYPFAADQEVPGFLSESAALVGQAVAVPVDEPVVVGSHGGLLDDFCHHPIGIVEDAGLVIGRAETERQMIVVMTEPASVIEVNESAGARGASKSGTLVNDVCPIEWQSGNLPGFVASSASYCNGSEDNAGCELRGFHLKMMAHIREQHSANLWTFALFSHGFRKSLNRITYLLRPVKLWICFERLLQSLPQ